MLSFLSQILGSKTLSVTALALILVLLVIVGVLRVKNCRLDDKIKNLEEVVDKKEADIVELNRQIQIKDLEIHYLQKGMKIATEYETKKQKAVEDGSTTKVEVLQTIMSNEEAQEWWDTPVPDSIADLLICQ